ncbi:MAG: hypothetical protein ACREQY_00305 [Candidatus Binatia bacterium]
MRSRRRLRILAAARAVSVPALALVLASTATAEATGGAVIDNGTVQLGVHDQGHLNVFEGTPSSGTGTPYVGLRYLPTGAEATAPGCLCEGWGAADGISGVSGYANEAVDGIQNMMPVTFSSTGSSAESVVEIGGTLRVSHDYRPSATPNLYEVTVTIENIGASTIEPRYRRVMDWDVEPTAFSEFVTANIGDATALLYNNNDGFTTANPLGSQSSGGVSPLVTGNFEDLGPNDHGALFDFGFDELEPGESTSFRIFYGATGTEEAALSALAIVQAEAFSLGQPDTENGPTTGEPNTFIFAFAGIGGTPVCVENGLRALDGTPGEGLASGFVHEQLEAAAAGVDPALADVVHTVNCNVVTPVEAIVNGAAVPASMRGAREPRPALPNLLLLPGLE